MDDFVLKHIRNAHADTSAVPVMGFLVSCRYVITGGDILNALAGLFFFFSEQMTKA